MVQATPAPWRQSLMIIASLLIPGAAPAAGEDTAAVQRPPELQQRLDAALAAKGAAYRPRTEHLHPDGRPRFTNRLILEDSPYLLQHAHNPVDWHAWGAEAFEQARREGKLVFLSIGYSTCHWCHVMERESFEDLEIARLLNRDYVAIKVDREVRPDLDQVYMTAVELLTGQGGWPMSSILTPEGETIIAGTYFPPDRFTRLLERARAGWQERPDELRAQARIVAAAVERALATRRQAAELDSGIAARGATALIAQHDDLQGGFGSAPKFPHEPRLALLLDRARRDADAESLDVAVVTLSAMARGGIHDQVGGGFHRYAIDDDWLVPHFEKMLYNQAQLARLYIQAAGLTGDPELERAARRTLDFVLRDLSSPEGVFYSATDADSADSENRNAEGRFFLWTPDDLRAALSPGDAALAKRFYGVSEAGNFEGRSILQIPREPETFARSDGISTRELWARIDGITATLYRARGQRPHPHRDEKILTGWNGLLIAALAEAGAALDAPRYLSAAEVAADLLWERVRPQPGALQRVYLEGRASTPAQQEDYAFLGAGMVALYDATGEGRWLARAQELADALWSRFTDPEGGGLFMAEPDVATPAMARARDLSDGALPSGTSASLDLLASLSRRSDQPSNGERARALVASVSSRVRDQPEAFPSLLVALTRLREGEAGPQQYAARGALRAQAHVLSKGPGALRLVVDIDISPGWHINATRPREDYLIPTRLSLSEKAHDWVLGAPEYPAPEVIKLGFQSEPLAVYQGRVSIQARLERVSSTEPALKVVPARLRLQACNDTQCLPPETMVLRVPVAAL